MVSRKFGWHSGKLWCRGIVMTDTFFHAGTSEAHAVDQAVTGSVASGGGIVAHNIKLTTSGTAGAWAAGLFVNVTQGTTKNINGYLTAAEFEVKNSNTNVSDWFVITLNSWSTTLGSHSSYIALRDYGTTKIQSFLWVSTDHTIGTDSDTALFTSTADDAAATSHALRIIVGGTPYWILCTNQTPSTS